jgi:hypothetical protein
MCIENIEQKEKNNALNESSALLIAELKAANYSTLHWIDVS